MDILIKSFNRPYYLDRCIQSIKTFVVCSEYRIVVLDDGTPHKYLDKLTGKYPDIVILKSSLYDQKANDISNNSPNINSTIPKDLWLYGAKHASDYFVLLEDDYWFIDKIDLNQLEMSLKQEEVQILKLFWLGNPHLISENIIKKCDSYSIYKPKLLVKNPLLYKLIFHTYKFRIHDIFTFFNIYTDKRALHYYTIYAVAGAVFNKNYFLNVWGSTRISVDEGVQLSNAVKFIYKNRKAVFGFTGAEFLKTGFLSSATNQHKHYENVDIDMFAFNKIINEAWFNDGFDAMAHFPKDLDTKKIEAILNRENNAFAKKEEWQKWVAGFKKQYISFGCHID